MSLIDWNTAIRKYPELGTNTKRDSAEVDSYHVPFAVANLESALSGYFTVPFSSNNLTAVDLAVDLLYHRLTLGKTDKAKDVYDRAMKKIECLKNGDEGMVLVDGTFLMFNGNAYSSHGNYAPVFGMGQSVEFRVDSGQLQDEEDARW